MEQFGPPRQPFSPRPSRFMPQGQQHHASQAWSTPMGTHGAFHSSPIPDAWEQKRQAQAAYQANLADSRRPGMYPPVRHPIPQPWIPMGMQNAFHGSFATNQNWQPHRPVRQDPIPMPKDAQDEEQQLQAALKASLADSPQPGLYPSAKQHRVPQAWPKPMGLQDALHGSSQTNQNWQPHQPVRQDPIPVPKDASDEEQQLQAALKASLADTAGPGGTPQVWRDSEIHSHLKVGTAPDDGNCFFHSIIQLAGDKIARDLNIPVQSLQPRHIRQHVASTLIDQIIECEKSASAAEALIQSHPHLLHMQIEPEGGALLDLRNPQQDLAFRQALGRHADRCRHMSPATLTNLYYLASDRSWNNSTGDLFAPATAAAFPGLRLAVVTRQATQTFGEGQAKPQLLVLEGSHYVPAKLRD